MRTRAARPADAAALGHLMVESWLSAHRGQLPDVAWRARVEEWTPDVSARGWARVLDAQDAARVSDDVLLVAEEDAGATIVGLVHGTLADEDGTGEVLSLYVAPGRHRQGVGAALLRAGAAALRDRGAARLRLSVLTANVPARAFYEAMGGVETGHGTTDEEGHLLPTTIYEWCPVSALAGE